MKQEELMKLVAGRLHFASADGPAKAVHATLSALFEALPRGRAEALARELGVSGSLPVTGRSVARVSDFYARGAELLGDSQGRAIEQLQVVCAVLGRTLEGQTRSELLRQLPGDVADLFEHTERHELPPLHGTRDNSLADGRPGGSRPLSEHGPGARYPVSESRATGAQHSVANPNPHGDSKVSSTRGLTQEREHESLAEGRAKRP